VAVGILASGWLAGCGGGGDDAPPSQIANPAAVFCEDSGGTYALDDGTCTLPDGRVVDGWAYFYEQNPTASTSG
jgi:hypothetical protein